MNERGPRERERKKGQLMNEGTKEGKEEVKQDGDTENQ